MAKGFLFHWFIREYKTEDEQRDSSGNAFKEQLDLSKVGEAKVHQTN